MASVQKIREAQRAEGPASILAIGTANPPNCFYQADYPDFYFRVTNSQHKTQLKDKFKRICEKSMIKKRYMYLTEEIINKNPSICSYKAPSLDSRQEMLIMEVPKLAQEAALKALNEWGQPILSITHLIFCTISGIATPGADYQLMNLLGLPPSVQRIMIYNQGCFVGGTALRLAKDLAENNAGARVLVVCAEILAMFFHGPTETHLDTLVGQAIFADGASALIIGADPDRATERPLYQIVSATQTTIPDSENAIKGNFLEMGMEYSLSENVPTLIGNVIENCLVEAHRFAGNNVSDWNSLFYAVHPGGRAILDKVEEKLGLKEGKLRASRQVLSEYGNMGGTCVYFILDEMRKKCKEEGKSTTGEGLEWGVLIGLGPGVTVETVVLHSVEMVSTQ